MVGGDETLVLYHGTSDRRLESIFRWGLDAGTWLSEQPEWEFARAAATRDGGMPVMLEVHVPLALLEPDAFAPTPWERYTARSVIPPGCIQTVMHGFR